MKGWVHRGLAGALLRPCTPSCHIWHATQAVPHIPVPSHAHAPGIFLRSMPGFLREISSDARTS